MSGSKTAYNCCGNLLDGNLFSTTPAYDFIFGRNLLIYFDRATQVRVLDLLKRQLQPEGVLFIGPAEASLATQNGMCRRWAGNRPLPSALPPVTPPARST